MELGVYISTFNEELFIEDTLRDVVKVFPQVEVIDLGSKDCTLMYLNQFDIPVHRHVMPKKQWKHDPNTPGQEWTRLKNHYAAKHDWVFFIDGDEIYNEENLLKMKANIESRRYTAYRCGWKVLQDTPNALLQSNTIINGVKLYKTLEYQWRRGWPNEVLKPVGETHNKEPKEECDVWCWHGVLLPRTNSVEEDRPRVKKRQRKLVEYETLEWKEVHRWPWM